MDPKYEIRYLLRVLRDAWPQEQSDRLGLVYRGPADFVLQEGRWWKPKAAPVDYKRGAPKACYGNSIAAAVLYDLRYVQGYALHAASPLPVPHAWNADVEGNVVDLTWNPVGTAYLGVALSVERADDGTWNGDADPINDYRRDWPLLREKFRGRDDPVDPSWEPSPLLLALRAARAGEAPSVVRALAESLSEA